MPEQIQIQNNHSYFARECSISRNNPLHMIKVKSLGKKVVFLDLFHEGAKRAVNYDFFKESLFGKRGLYLMQDLGDDFKEAIAVPTPVEIPELPVKETFGNLLLKVFFKTKKIRFHTSDINTEDGVIEKIWCSCLRFAGIAVNDPKIMMSRSDVDEDKKYRTTRQVAQYLACKYTNMSLEKIGYYTGGKHHTTVLSSQEVIKAMIIAEDTFVLEMIEFVNIQLKR